MSPPVRTTIGATRFRCIGGDCEYTCCSGWAVPVDRVHYEALQAKLGQNRALRDEFKRSVERVPKNDPRGWAAMRLTATGDCACLGPDRLCTLQARFGEELLPDTCAQYPRALRTVGAQKELWGMLSCPEMARLCLITPDGMELAETQPFARPIEGRASKADRPYERHLDDIRSTIFEILSRRSYPISIRFFFLAYLGKRTASFFHDGVDAIDPKQLAAEILRLQTPAILDSWATAFRSLRMSPELNAVVVGGILSAGADRNLGPIIAKVLASFVHEGAVTEERAGVFSAQPLALWERYLARRRTWEASFSEHLDLIFENYAKSYWLREWYVTSPNLLIHLQLHLCQVAVIRFLIFGHPDLVAGAALTDRGAQQQALDRVAVEVVSRVSRAIEHNAAFLRDLQAALGKRGMQDFAHTTILTAA